MSRTDYAPRQTFTGDGANDEFSFDFKIEALTQLRVIKLDDSGNLVFNVQGDDAVYLDTVDFDSDDGGGTVTFIDPPESNYTVIFLLANDEPTQDAEFRGKFEFTLRAFEAALDKLAGAIQRLAYRASGSVRLHDAIDPDDFDTSLPVDIQDSPNKVFTVNSDGDAVELVDPEDLATVQAEHAITANQAASALSGESFSGTTYLAVIFQYVIVQSTTVFASGLISMHYRNGTWELAEGECREGASATHHGITWSVSQVGVIGQLEAAEGSGLNGTIYLRKFLVAA